MNKENNRPEPGVYECPNCGHLVQVDERDYSIPPCPQCKLNIDPDAKVNQVTENNSYNND